MLSGVFEYSHAMRSDYGQEFSLELGGSVTGPEGLRLGFAGCTLVSRDEPPEPLLKLSVGAVPEVALFVRSGGVGPDAVYGRVLCRGWLVTIRSCSLDWPPTSGRLTAVIERAGDHVRGFCWDEPFVLEAGSFVRSPEGWRLGLAIHDLGDDCIGVELKHERGDPPRQSWYIPGPGPGSGSPARRFDGLVARVEELFVGRESGTPSARLRIWDLATPRWFEFGRPFVLRPDETAVGPGDLQLQLKAFGWEVGEDGDEPFAELAIGRGAADEFLSLDSMEPRVWVDCSAARRPRRGWPGYWIRCVEPIGDAPWLDDPTLTVMVEER